MIPTEAVHGFIGAQKKLLRQTYDDAWQQGVDGYEPDEDPSQQPDRDRDAALAGLTGAALLAARRLYPYVAPARPDPVRRAIALAPSYRSLNSMVDELTSLSPAAPEVGAAGVLAPAADAFANALLDWLDSNSWRLDGGVSVAWAGEQNGYGEAADADGQLLEWVDEGDDRVCSDCEELGNMPPQPLADWPSQPGDGVTECNVGCFAPETPVEGAFLGGLQAWYAGQMIELETASGARVALTPNHPVATPQGFVPAGLLRQGNYLFGHVVRQRAIGPVGSLAPTEHDDHAPAAIEQVFGALEELGGHLSVAARRNDLHGDGRRIPDGQIKVVATDRMLIRDAHSRLANGKREVLLEQAVALRTASRPVARQQFAVPDLATARRCPHGRALPLNERPVGLHRLPLQALRIGLPTQFDTRLAQPAGQCAAADAQFVGQLLQRGSGEIVPDQLVRVHRVRNWSGHVYDLQSTTGWLLAGSLVCSNCRCSLEVAEVQLVPGDTYAPQLTDAQDALVSKLSGAQSMALAATMPDAQYLN